MRLYNKVRKKIKAKEDDRPMRDSNDSIASPATRAQSSHAVDGSATQSQQSLPKTNDVTSPTIKTPSPSGQTSKQTEVEHKNLWQLAWEELDVKDQQTLAGGVTQDDHDQTGPGNTVDLVDQIIQSTEASYKEYQKKSSSGTNSARFRELAHRVLDATLSFKDIISAAVAFDPTGHAASAWTVISLGLTMTQNHHEIRMAVFESSAFLTDVLARCAFVEKEHYRDNHLEDKTLMENASKQVYIGLLQYAALLRRAQQTSGGKKLLESLSSATDHPLKQLETKIVSYESKLRTWVSNDAYLRHKKKADDMLSRIDESITLMKGLHRKLDLNNLRSADGASFDSYLNQHEDECLPGTRIDLLQQVYDWANAPQSQCIFWLNGMAGTGKSTISRTVARVFRDEGRLGGSFFFKKGEADRGNAKRFFPTLTRQLVTTVPDIASFVSEAIESDPDIATKSFVDQFTTLILQPLCNMKLEKQKGTMVLVIDALDECDGDEDIKLLLRLLPRFEQVEQTRIRIFVTSRPELPIRLGFQTIDIKDKHQDLILHEIPKSVIKEDLSLFLKHKLNQIQIDRSLPEDWLGDNDFFSLVDMSVPLFIFAATVCRVFEDPDLLPMESLREILAHQNEESRLDATYLPVLQRLFSSGHSEKTRKKMIEEFREIVGTILTLETPLSVTSLSKLLGLSKEKIGIRLNRLHAVLRIPDSENEPIRLFHLSFRDFLLDPESSNKTELYVDSGPSNQKVAERCLDVMKSSLKKNICSLEFEGMPRTEIDPDTISNSIPAELQYCCRYWTQHLEKSADPTSMMQKASAFLQEFFIYWAEVMCILGYALEIAEGIERLQGILKALHNDGMTDMASFLYDAQRFILKCQHIANDTPLQLYCSGLLFAPERSLIRTKFSSNIPEWICQYPRVEENWSAEVQILEGHDQLIQSVAFSAEGRWLASGSMDRSVKIWNAKTGLLHITIQTGSLRVDSVAFSPDCQWIASASADGVRIWDPQDGARRHYLRDKHSSNLSRCVAFSTAGNLLASGSVDMAVKIWSPDVGTLLRTLHGHAAAVTSVAFSSKGWLASGSVDGKINIWDEDTGDLRVAIEDSDVTRLNVYVAFSPDSRWLASTSSDKAVKIWDSETGTLQRKLQGQEGPFNSLAFSPDGKWLVSGSTKAITMWNFAKCTLNRIFKGNLDYLLSVAFSPDGRWLACASDFFHPAITIWDPFAERPPSEPDIEQSKGSDSSGFEEAVDSIDFSRPDGRFLVSGSVDKVRVWDPETGTSKDHILLDEFSTRAMILSHQDTRFLASSGGDRRIRIWDLELKAIKHTLRVHDNFFHRAFAFSSNNRRLASLFGLSFELIQIWDLETNTVEYTLKGHFGRVMCGAFSPSHAECFVSGAEDGGIIVWDLKTGRLKHEFETSDAPVNCVAFPHTPRQGLVSFSTDMTISIWNLETGTLQRKISFKDEILARNDSLMEVDGETLSFSTGTALFPQIDAKPDYFIRPKNGDDAQICVWQNWIFIKGKPVIWIPYSHRPRSIAAFGSRLAMGQDNGSVSFIKFRY